MYLNQTDRLPRTGSCLIYLCVWTDYSLGSFCILTSTALKVLRTDWLTSLFLATILNLNMIPVIKISNNKYFLKDV